jgi:hypothetical protein
VNATYILNQNSTTTIDGLLFEMREQMCAYGCTLPSDFPPGVAVANVVDNGQGCVMALALPLNAEVYLYRTTQDPTEQQECWDSTIAIIENCVRGGANQGWWNGDHIGQFYQGGVQPLNGANGTSHAPLNPAMTLEPLKGPGVGLPSVTTTATLAALPTPAFCFKSIYGEDPLSVSPMTLQLNDGQTTDIPGLLGDMGNALCSDITTCTTSSTIPSSAMRATSGYGSCTVSVYLPGGLVGAVSYIGDGTPITTALCNSAFSAIIGLCVKPGSGNGFYYGQAEEGHNIFQAGLVLDSIPDEPQAIAGLTPLQTAS